MRERQQLVLWLMSGSESVLARAPERDEDPAHRDRKLGVLVQVRGQAVAGQRYSHRQQAQGGALADVEDGILFGEAGLRSVGRSVGRQVGR